MRALPAAASTLAAALVFSGCLNIQVPPVRLGGSEGPPPQPSGRGTPAVPGGSADKPPPDAGRPASSSGGWREVLIGATGALTVGTEHGALFYAFDTLAYPGRAVDLAARLRAAKGLGGIPGVTLGFYRGDDLVALAKTDKDGLASAGWTPPAAGDHEFAVKVVSLPDDIPAELRDVNRVTPAPLLVAARDKDAEFVVIDLDHTVVDASFFRVLVLGGARPMADSVEVARRIAAKYTIVYLTHRPDLLARKSKAWLMQHRYPRGPLMVSELRQAFGDSGKFKTARLAGLRKSFANVRIGIGDKPSDAQAYVDNGLTAYLIPNYKAKPKDIRKAAGEIRSLRGGGRLNVVESWREVEAGIFGGKTYPPETFARWLEGRAARMEAEEARKKKDDDDDD